MVRERAKQTKVWDHNSKFSKPLIYFIYIGCGFLWLWRIIFHLSCYFRQMDQNVRIAMGMRGCPGTKTG